MDQLLSKTSMTASMMLEYLYCPRFVYFMEVLKIPQNEEMRFKVQMGRKVHDIKALQNKDYKRQRIGMIQKYSEQKLYDDERRIHGIIDEILILKDSTAAPLDYKFAEYQDIVYEGHRIQLAMYGLLISRNIDREVNQGYIVYTRSKNKLVKVELDEDLYQRVNRYIDEILRIIDKGCFPKATKQIRKCVDCTYKTICLKKNL